MFTALCLCPLTFLTFEVTTAVLTESGPTFQTQVAPPL